MAKRKCETASPYSGKLAEPIPLPRKVSTSEGSLASLLSAEETIEKFRRDSFLSNATEKMLLLCQHYGIEWAGDDTDWKRLAIELAFRHVDGFKTKDEKPKKPRGAPRKRETQEAKQARLDLYRLVEGKKCLAQASNKIILQRLAKNKVGELPAYYRKNGNTSYSTLREDYRTATDEEKTRMESEKMRHALAVELSRPSLFGGLFGQGTLLESSPPESPASPPKTLAEALAGPGKEIPLRQKVRVKKPRRTKKSKPRLR